jgi:hypothetical protein
MRAVVKKDRDLHERVMYLHLMHGLILNSRFFLQGNESICFVRTSVLEARGLVYLPQTRPGLNRSCEKLRAFETAKDARVEKGEQG